jgi:hypothetical protein
MHNKVVKIITNIDQVSRRLRRLKEISADN